MANRTYSRLPVAWRATTIYPLQVCEKYNYVNVQMLRNKYEELYDMFKVPIVKPKVALKSAVKI